MIVTHSRRRTGSGRQRPGQAGRVGVPGSVASLNLGVRVAVELATLAAFGYWGASVDGPIGLRVSLAVVAPLTAMVAWSRLVAPKAPRRLVGLAALGAELSIVAGAAWALVWSGMGLVGVTLWVVAVGNSFLIRTLGQYGSAGGMPVVEARP